MRSHLVARGDAQEDERRVRAPAPPSAERGRAARWDQSHKTFPNSKEKV